MNQAVRLPTDQLPQSFLHRHRISLCTTCMGRLPDLMKTLPTNIELNAHYENLEFVILDYNSGDGLEEWMRTNMQSHMASGRVVYYRTDEPAYYSMTHSRNVAFKAATGDIVCNVDADNFTVNTSVPPEMRPKQCFAEHLNALANLHGPKLIFAKERKVMRGRLGFYRQDFISVLGGFDEDLKGYGHDDHDLCERALGLGFKFIPFGGAFYSRIHTPKKVRGVNMEVKQWQRTEAANQLLSEARIAAGQFTANVGRSWGKCRLKKNFSEWVDIE